MGSWQFSVRKGGLPPEGAPVMNPVKRGICIDTELAVWIYHVSRLAKICENRVIVRMLEIAREDVAPFDEVGLRRIFREPWDRAMKVSALMRVMRKRSHGHLNAITATRLTLADKGALQEIATKQRTTVSALQRQLVESLTAKSSSEVVREKLRT
jgi:hypothetical protein